METEEKRRLWHLAQEVALQVPWTVDSVYSLLLNHPRLDSLHATAVISAAVAHSQAQGDDCGWIYAYQLAPVVERSIVRKFKTS